MMLVQGKRIWKMRVLVILAVLLGALMLALLTSFLYSAYAIPESEQGIWHKVRPGDTVWEIAKHYGVSQRRILLANRLRNPKRLRVGKRLFIPGVSMPRSQGALWHTIRRGDTLWDLARKYGVSVREIQRANPGLSVRRLYVGKRVLIPRGSSQYYFASPLDGRLFLTSGYGYRRHPISGYRRFHHGIDLRAKVGTLVRAAEDGEVIFVGYYGGYGKTVMLRHKGGYETRYGHLSRILVPHGRKVQRGQPIGRSGNTGYSTGPHLHFEVRKGGKSLNPLPYLQGLRRIS